MKIPAKGQYKFVVSELPDSVKNQLSRDGSPFYFGSQTGKPIGVGADTFPFIVGRFKLTLDNKFEQVGNDVVLCQTEEEMKESVQLLSETKEEVMVAFQCGNIGMVGFLQANGRCVVPGFTIGEKTSSDGKKIWIVAELEMDKATGRQTLKRKLETSTKQEAEQIRRQWIEQSDQDKKSFFDNVAKSKMPPVPPNPIRCDTLTSVDMDDAAKARMDVLRRQWPHCFDIFDRRNTGRLFAIDECRRAFVLDWAEQGENPLAVKDKIPTGADMEFWNALKKASDRAARSKKKLLLLKVDYLIAFNWQLGWCYLPGRDLAKKVSELAGKAFTAGQIKQRRDKLGLVAKNHSGQLPNGE